MKLNAGCAKKVMAGWINIELHDKFDVLTPENLSFAAKGHKQYKMDLLKPFPIPSQSLDYIYWEHVIEHFDLIELRVILKEFHRTLKPDGVFRTACPDLDYFMSFYDDKAFSFVPRRWYDVTVKKNLTVMSKAHMLNLVLTSHGHKFTHSFESAKQEFLAAGFDNVVRCEYGESKHHSLTMLETRGEEQDPLILEAIKT